MNDKRNCTLFGAQSTAAEVIAGVQLGSMPFFATAR